MENLLKNIFSSNNSKQKNSCRKFKKSYQFYLGNKEITLRNGEEKLKFSNKKILLLT